MLQLVFQEKVREGGVEEWKRQSSNMGDIKRNGRKEKERRRDRGVR